MLRSFSCTLTMLLAAGCAGGPPPLGSPSDVRALRPITTAEATPPPNCGKYGACSVLACFGYICFAFTTEGSVQAELTSGIVNAQGVATDHHGNSYIADSGSSKVFEYGPLFTPLINTYQDPNQVPLDLDVDAKNELLAVSNESTTGGWSGKRERLCRRVVDTDGNAHRSRCTGRARNRGRDRPIR